MGTVTTLARPDDGGLVASDVSCLPAAEMRVLAALSRRPRGLKGVSAVAGVAGVAPADAAAALCDLEDRGLVTTEPETGLPGAPAPERTLWRLCAVDAWFTVADAVRTVELLEPPTAPMPERLPERFAKLFWWGDPALIELPRDAAFVAEHLLSYHDLDAWAWALETLPPEALERVADKECTPPPVKAMIRNALREPSGLTV